MKEISITLEGEEAVFSWREGKVHCTGYDLKSEETVLALTSFGEGIGVLLVAGNACCRSEDEFISEVKNFVVGHQKISSKEFDWHNWPKGQLLFEYYSYSPDPEIRWLGMYSARLSERHYKRILKDPEIEIKLEMANLKELPEQYFRTLATLSNTDINYALARNKKCPGNVLEILARNNKAGISAYIREVVALHVSCPIGILEMLSQDNDPLVRRSVAQNPNAPAPILSHLAQDKDPLVRMYVARNPSCLIGILEILCKDKNKATQDYARQSLGKRKDLVV